MGWLEALKRPTDLGAESGRRKVLVSAQTQRERAFSLHTRKEALAKKETHTDLGVCGSARDQNDVRMARVVQRRAERQRIALQQEQKATAATGSANMMHGIVGIP